MVNNRFQIPEPDVPLAHAISPQQIDLMFIPLLAFDAKGTRVGRGGGYYDRTLSTMRPGCLLGIAYALQYQPLIPPDPWDVALDGIVTELNVNWI